MPKYSTNSLFYLRREAAERDIIFESLEKFNGNITYAAEELGLHRANLHRKMRQLNISKFEKGIYLSPCRSEAEGNFDE